MAVCSPAVIWREARLIARSCHNTVCLGTNYKARRGPGLDTLLKDSCLYMNPVTRPEVASCILSECDPDLL
jgi:hypothetical protein